MKTLLTCLLLFPLACVAQAYKCQVNGKWEYQSYPCTNAPTQSVDTRSSSEGVTGLRKDADRMAAKERAQKAQKQRAAAAFIASQEKLRAEIRQDRKHSELVDAVKSNNKNSLANPSPRPPTYECSQNLRGGMDCSPRPY